MICPTLDDDPQTIYPRYYWSSKTLKRGRRISWWNSTLLLNWVLKKKKSFFFLCFFLFLWRVALGSLHKFPHRLIAIDRSSQFRWVAGNVIVRREKPPVVDCQHLFCFILWRLRNRLIVNNLLFRQPSCYPNWFSFLSPSKKKKVSFYDHLPKWRIHHLWSCPEHFCFFSLLAKFYFFVAMREGRGCRSRGGVHFRWATRVESD